MTVKIKKTERGASSLAARDDYMSRHAPRRDVATLRQLGRQFVLVHE